MREPVASFDDSRLDDYRNLPDSRLLTTHGRFVAEGRLVVARLLASSRFPVRSVMATRVAVDALAGALAIRPDVPVYEVTPDTMSQVAGFHVHRGCLAIGERTDNPTEVALAESARLLVALEAVANADNVGSVFRHAAAFGAHGVLLDEATADPLYRKALRTSMGATLQVPFARVAHWHHALQTVRSAGFSLVALTPAAGAQHVADVAQSLAGTRVALVLGHEGDGLSQHTLAACDVQARIPIEPGIDSINVATAAAIALYEVAQRQPASR